MSRKKYDVDSLDNIDPATVAWMADFIEHVVKRYFRAEVRGAERIPDGAALYVANHNAFPYTPEAYLLNWAAYRRGGLDYFPYSLTHDYTLKIPYVDEFMLTRGSIRANNENAERVLRAGKKLLVFPGGQGETFRPFRERNLIKFYGRRGYIRLALRTGAPIVPAVAAGAHALNIVLSDLPWVAKLAGADKKWRTTVFPVVLSFPWGITLGLPPPYIPYPSRILMEILEPIRFERVGPEAAQDDAYVAACAELVEGRMQATLTRLAEERKR